MTDSDVLLLWESFPGWIKGTTLAIILTYLTTLISAIYWVDLPEGLASVFIYWPFVLIVWAMLIWFAFSFIVMFGIGFGGMFVKDAQHQPVFVRAKKVILYIPILIGSVISVSSVFMYDIFGIGDSDSDEIEPAVAETGGTK